MTVALITGSTRGIGRAIADALADQGVTVVIHGRHTHDVDMRVQEIRQRGKTAIGIAADFTDRAATRMIVAQIVDAFGRIDILVNNAGLIRDCRLINMTEQDWHDVMDVHLHAVFSVTQAAVLVMKQQMAGIIINMTSLAGLQGNAGQANYATAKAGILGLTWTLAKELATYNIRVNALSPAALTDMTRLHVERAILKAEQRGETLPSYWKIGSTQAVAKAVCLLCEDDAAHVTGQVIGVNGDQITLYEHPGVRPLTSLSDLWQVT